MALSRAARQYLGVRAILPPDLQIALRAPTSSDKAHVKGTLWLNTAASTAYMWPGSGNWIFLGSSTTGTIVTLTGNSGGAISPVGGNISILGGAGVSVVGTAGTLTISLTGGGGAMDSFLPDAGTNPVVPTALGEVTMAGTANQITTTGGLNTLTFSIPAVFIAPGSIASTTTIVAGTSLTATTSVTATLGNITATNGNIVKGTAGNKDVYTSVATNATAGANSAGTVTLVGGTATVATTAVTANSKIRWARQSIGATGAAALGIVTIGTITAGVSFVINAVQAADATALQASDVSLIWWEIVN